MSLRKFGNLEVIHQDDDYQASLVFVQAIEGRYVWTEWLKSSETFWPKELLPESLSDLRVRILWLDIEMSPRWFIEKDIEVSWRERTTQLAQSLLQAQVVSPIPKPIIFVCHSLGGQLVQRVLLRLWSDPAFTELHKSHILDQTYGIVYFGTPHRGFLDGQSEDPACLRRSVVHRICMTILCKGTYDVIQLLDSKLGDNTLLLANISKDFMKISRSFKVFVFYETVKSPNSGVIAVPYEHAVPDLDLTESLDLREAHFRICKFESAETPGYQQVCDVLRRFVAAATQHTTLEAQDTWGVSLEKNDSDRVLTKGHMEHPGSGLGTQSREKFAFSLPGSGKLDYKPGSSTRWPSGNPPARPTKLGERSISGNGRIDTVREPFSGTRDSACQDLMGSRVLERIRTLMGEESELFEFMQDGI